MSLEVRQFFMRPGKDVQWFQNTLPESHYEYIRTKYAGKVKGAKEESEDGDILFVTFVFTDADAQEEFINDEYLREKVRERDAYNIENNIIQLV
jgi:hypothetical protein